MFCVQLRRSAFLYDAAAGRGTRVCAHSTASKWPRGIIIRSRRVNATHMLRLSSAAAPFSKIISGGGAANDGDGLFLLGSDVCIN